MDALSPEALVCIGILAAGAVILLWPRGGKDSSTDRTSEPPAAPEPDVSVTVRNLHPTATDMDVRAQVGQAGEDLVQGVLAQLPDEADVFYDVQFATRKARTQIDHVVLWRGHLFVVETKHWFGRAKKDPASSSWIKLHKGEVSILRNPASEVKNKARLLKDLFAEHRIRLPWVNGCVCFTGDLEIHHEAMDQNIPFILGPEDLYNAFMFFQASGGIASGDIEAVCKRIAFGARSVRSARLEGMLHWSPDRVT
jgi:hypothetical protein